MLANVSQQELAAQLKRYRLSVDEYERMGRLLGRPPVGVEWALFSALWSEHCSYKSSKIHLRKLAATLNEKSSSVGENAGVLDLGRGEKIAFKMESHNHPSFIEPFQGAATGVGGILRDVFTMGARPIANANYLCFGNYPPDQLPDYPSDNCFGNSASSVAETQLMKKLITGVVAGISHYGNCVGVPTVTGQTNYHPSYNKNILVNALALGYFSSQDKVASSQAKGVGNWVVYIGAKTGKDGVHGAAMASESFSADSDSKKPNVQIGDPYYEKLLIEATLEVIQKDLVVAIQDMGAAGLISSSFEMAAKGGVGMEMDLSAVPLRDSTMLAEEILLSESQERMLLVCQPSQYSEIAAIMHRWGLEVAKVGVITDSKKIKLIFKNEVLTEIDPLLLVDEAPVYERAYDVEKLKKLKATLTSELNLPSIVRTEQQVKAETSMQFPASWIYEQFDQRVGLNTIHDASYDVAVLRLPESGRTLGLVLGCRTRLMQENSWIGAMDAILYPYLQLAIKGFQGVGVTDCLNFGNPEKAEVMTDFVSSVEAMVLAAKELNTPIISGNVSFYNETLGQNILPTPATGMVGLQDVDSTRMIPAEDFLRSMNSNSHMDVCSGDELYLLSLPILHWGVESVQKVKIFARDLRSLAIRPEVLVTQMVSLQGLESSIKNLESAPDLATEVAPELQVKAKTKFKIKVVTSFQKLNANIFYQVLMVIKKGSSAKLLPSLASANSDITTELIGTVTEVPYE